MNSQLVRPDVNEIITFITDEVPNDPEIRSRVVSSGLDTNEIIVQYRAVDCHVVYTAHIGFDGNRCMYWSGPDDKRCTDMEHNWKRVILGAFYSAKSDTTF